MGVCVCETWAHVNGLSSVVSSKVSGLSLCLGLSELVKLIN